MFKRDLFSQQHEAFRAHARRFIAQRITPFHRAWEEAGEVPREVWAAAGEAGLLCCSVPVEYGGPGLDYLHNVVFYEELGRAGVTAPGFMIHVDMVSSYLTVFGSEEQKKRWLPGMVRGQIIGALGITEPHAGSDVKAIRTRAVRDGDDYVIDGQKTFISNGRLCDFVMLATKTDSGAGAHGVSLFVVETTRAGFIKGRKLPKLGLRGQDTSELFFEGVRVPAGNLVGGEGRGFKVMMHKLAQERLAQAIRSTAVCEAVIGWTIERLAQQTLEEESAGERQSAQFTLAELQTDIVVARVMTDRCIEQFIADQLSDIDAAMVKMYVTNLHCRVVDECLQFFGEQGYSLDSAIGRAYADARIGKIAGGAIEVMKHLIGRDLVAGRKATP